MNFSKQFAEEVILPDGSVASSVADVDRYLRANHLARAGDYSADYIKKVRQQREKAQQEEIFAEFLYNYKRNIWNE